MNLDTIRKLAALIHLTLDGFLTPKRAQEAAKKLRHAPHDLDWMNQDLLRLCLKALEGRL